MTLDIHEKKGIDNDTLFANDLVAICACGDKVLFITLMILNFLGRMF